jgi:hypothetical protein
MNTPPTRFIAAAVVLLPAVCSGGELFDAPGPGYRQQSERFFPQVERQKAFRIRVTSPVFSVHSLSDAAFGQPIRLFEQLPYQVGFSLESASTATPQTPK